MSRILITERVGESGVRLLRDAGLQVDVEIDPAPQELRARIGAYDGILIRSGTRLTADVLEHATRLRAIGRAGVGVDNVDVPAATKLGIVVVNAPQSNVVTAAEHTMALLLSLARNIPQAHASLVAGRWERSRFSGVELYGKTLGILGFGRIGQLVAQRARAFEMRLVAYDPFVGDESFRELGVERAAAPEDVYAVADFLTVHLPRTAETVGLVDDDALARMRDGVRILNVARGGLVDEDALRRALERGKVAGAALDVFAVEPVTAHPLFEHPQVVVTPHLGASTAEAADRAGLQAAEQLLAALRGGPVTSAVNVAAIAREDLEVVGPFLPLCRSLGRLAATVAEETPIEALEIELLGRLADRDARSLTAAVLVGALGRCTDERVNEVNARAIAAEHGIEVVEESSPAAPDFTDLVRVGVVAGGQRMSLAGTTIGHEARAHLVEAWGRSVNIPLEDNLALFRYRDQPGMLGRVGAVLGEHGINIRAASAGRASAPAFAVLAVSTDVPMPEAAVEEIVECDGFLSGCAVVPDDQPAYAAAGRR
jgi:D-3-phosphoglycerate dehydrogenase